MRVFCSRVCVFVSPCTCVFMSVCVCSCASVAYIYTNGCVWPCVFSVSVYPCVWSRTCEQACTSPSTHHATEGAVEGHEERPGMRASAEAGAVEQQHDDAGGAAGDDGVHHGLGHRRRVALLADGRLRAAVEGQEAEQEDEAPQGSQLWRGRSIHSGDTEVIRGKRPVFIPLHYLDAKKYFEVYTNKG